MKTLLLAALGLAAVTTMGPTSALAGPACLEVGRIWSWKVVDDKTLIVEDDTHQKFKMSLMFNCPNLSFKERVGFKSIGGSELSCLSKGDDVLVRDIGFPSRCPITDIAPYTPAMEAADKAAAAAKAQQDGSK